tara:strand:- start:77 stop:619 length:543 start_codon:yes stop_codon:yes gene_type:complete
MAKRKNLNELFPEPVRRKRSETVAARSGVQVLFHNIEATILEHIADPHCHNVAILGPYFSNLNILKACSTLAGTSIVTTYDKYLKSKVRMDAFNELVPLLDARVKTLNRGKGRNKTILHTKAIILLDYEKRPFKVISGSWNFTQNSENNIETMTVYQNPQISNGFWEEFNRVWSVSKKFV